MLKTLQNLFLGLKFSFSYFTIFPIHFNKNNDLSEKKVLAYMLFFFPLVGLFLGVVTVLLYTFLAHLGWYGAVISGVFYMILYGFIHTEAIMDVADAIYASHSGKDAYEIIKEPTVGAMGVLYVSALTLLKLSGIVYLLMHGYLLEFISILIISRLSLLLLFRVHEFRSSFANSLKNALTKNYLFTSFFLFTLIGSILLHQFVLFLILGLVFALIISYVIKSKIGFVNGDVLGATLEGVEILLLIGVVI